MATETSPIALTIAGSDPSGGAGIQADLKTFSALGVYGATVITALTAQNTRGVFGVFAIPPDFIAAQFRSVISDLDVSAIKTGMLGDAATVETVSKSPFRGFERTCRRRSGDGRDERRRFARAGGHRCRAPVLIPRAALITPNVPEAAKLLDRPLAETEADMQAQAEALMKFGCGAVLLKGGHAHGPGSRRYLFRWHDAPHLAPATH